MDSSYFGNSFLSKVNTMVSSLYGSLLQASSFQFPMQTQKPRSIFQSQSSFLGLKTLGFSEQEGEEKVPRVIRSVEVGSIKSMPLTPSSSCSFASCSALDDLIGSESGVCLTSNSEEMENKSTDHQPEHYHHEFNRSKQNRRFAAKKQFPPPIPFLVAPSGDGSNRTHEPWILTRHYTEGRLIMKLERVRQHQYLESYRENSRLILKVVPTPGSNGTEEEDPDRDLQFIEEERETEEESNEENEELIEEEEEEAEEMEKATEESTMAFKSFTYSGEGCGKMEGRNMDYGFFGSAPLRQMGTVM